MRFQEPTGPSRISGTHRWYKSCPACGNDRWHFSVNTTSGLGDCKVCGAAGPVDGFLVTAPLPVTEHVWAPIEIPDPRPLGTEALAYLASRGIDQERAAGLGMCESGAHPGRVIVPYFWRGECIYWSGRALPGHGLERKYYNAPGKHPLYLPYWNGYSRAVLVEGVFDAIRVSEAGPLGIALGGRTLARHCEPMLWTVLESMGGVSVMLDADALEGALRLSNRLSGMGYTPEVLVLAEGDPGSTPVERLRELVGLI